MVIFSGDCSNPQELTRSEFEIRQFIDWFASLNVKYKIFVAGNHDCALEAGYVNKQDFTLKNIIFLENDSIEIEGLKIWGSPITPAFGTGWAYKMRRDRLHDLWATIPDDTDIIITHGPPSGILDLSFDRNGTMEFCGCKALAKRVRVIEPKLVCFGHIHDMSGIVNAGYLKQSDHKTIYSNGTVVRDGRFDLGAINNGNIFEL